jgi:hypothetical protein
MCEFACIKFGFDYIIYSSLSRADFKNEFTDLNMLVTS